MKVAVYNFSLMYIMFSLCSLLSTLSRDSRLSRLQRLAMGAKPRFRPPGIEFIRRGRYLLGISSVITEERTLLVPMLHECF